MIIYDQYVGKWSESKDLTPIRVENIRARLLPNVASLYTYLVSQGVIFHRNPATNSEISGSQYGGFRPQSCKEGAPLSAHKEGLAVDVYDPFGEIDAYLLKHPDVLERFGIYIEHPDKTVHWSHWSVKPPKSGKHIFYP